jgi:hypothetical protein
MSKRVRGSPETSVGRGALGGNGGSGGALGRVSHGFGDTRRKETGEKRELTGDLHRGGMGRTLELSTRWRKKWSRMGALGSYRAGAREGLEEGGASLPCVALSGGSRLGYVPAARSE